MSDDEAATYERDDNVGDDIDAEAMAEFLDGFAPEGEGPADEPATAEELETKKLKRAEILALVLDREEETGAGNNALRRMKKAELAEILERVGPPGEAPPIRAQFAPGAYQMPAAAGPPRAAVKHEDEEPGLAQRIDHDPSMVASLASFGGMLTVETARFVEAVSKVQKPMGYVVDGAAASLEEKRPVIDQLMAESIEAGEMDGVVEYVASPLVRLGIIIGASITANARPADPEPDPADVPPRQARPPPIVRPVPGPPRAFEARPDNIGEIGDIWEREKARLGDEKK